MAVISPHFLYHWVSAQNIDEAFATLVSIIKEKTILGSSKLIKGGYSCVCFTRAGIENFRFNNTRYWPYGICIPLNYVLSLGGAPVIYQSNMEFYHLAENSRWQHARYEPGAVDFLWECEYRIHTPEMYLPPAITKIVVWGEEAAERFVNDYHQNEMERYQEEWQFFEETQGAGMGEEYARLPQCLEYSIDIFDFS
jgi:hypothetical protein